MEQNIHSSLEQKIKKQRRKRVWKRIVSVLGSLVVFCTTYALILPAITMSESTYCGNEEHSHDESCYMEEVICGLIENDTNLHEHVAECYKSGEQIVCGLVETEGHKHEETCYENIKELNCLLTEDAEHVHGEECYCMNQKLVCELEEVEAHIHSETCVEITQQELICEEKTEAQHQHTDVCYENRLICEMEEHVHKLACFSNPKADVETASDWEQTIPKDLTGFWEEDVLLIAKSQLGYKESENNYIVTESESTKGYTRYGQWYGDKYGHWCAMFVSFCLDYAGVEGIPLNSNCQNWIEVLSEEEYNMYRKAETYMPGTGDLIFFDWDSVEDGKERRADHIGFVAEIIPETEETPAQIKTIEGNSSDRVSYVTYELNDERILGYGELPEQEPNVLVNEGDDYTVTVTYKADTKIPAHAELVVNEILAGSEEYDTYYQQAIEAMGKEKEEVSFARFFDIHFLVNGEIVEPTASVDIEITYKEGAELTEEMEGSAVHFAEEGIEVLDASVYSENGENADAFAFTQDSFSVTGTILSTRAVEETGTMAVAENATGTINTSIYEVSKDSGKKYILYAMDDDGNCYAFANRGDAIPFSIENGLMSGSDSLSTAKIQWEFKEINASSDYAQCTIKNTEEERFIHTYNNGGNQVAVTDGTAWPNTWLQKNSDGSFEIICNDKADYIRLNDGAFVNTENRAQSTKFYLIDATYLRAVWFDGTAGSLMSLYQSANELRLVPSASKEAQITVPSTWKSPRKYTYKIRGWYDIHNSTYYKAGETATIRGNTVFYPEWEPVTYDIGIENEHVVGRLDTNDFITTEVFDYNLLFDMYSNKLQSSSVSRTGHTETWTMVNDNNVPYGNQRSLEFVFIDYDNDGELSYANNRRPNNENPWNQSLSTVTTGILNTVKGYSGKDLLDMLFNTQNAYDINNKTGVLGKTYVGSGNYLYQFNDEGYYYYDSKLNAASYNQSEQRFYVYDYLERTSDSLKDGNGNEAIGAFSDFLPFNSPYANIPTGQDWVNYNKVGNGEINTADNLRDYPNYQYDAKDNKEQSVASRIGTNYWFGIKSSIRFYLPNDAGEKDSDGNYGNISTYGKQMEFRFAGDDDVWVCVDGELLLDVGGMHGVRGGSINFSTGEVKDHNGEFIRTIDVKEGEHILTVYYMERGSSQSNCAIYFNIAPRYALEIQKEDIFNSKKLDGAEFTVYTDLRCTQRAKLWDSYEAYSQYATNVLAEQNSKATFEIEDGIANMWGFSAGKTYYIKETAPPDDNNYGPIKGIIRMTLSYTGEATYDVIVIEEDGTISPGFDVVGFRIDEDIQKAYMVVTNQKTTEETKKLQVTKKWDSSVEDDDIPKSITVYLMQDGERVGRDAVLNAKNNWTYTWEGLPKYDENREEIIYTVGEELVPGFRPTITVKSPINGVEQVEIINRPIPKNEQTSLKVYKVWADGNDIHYRDSITLHLLEDGKDTGNKLVLNKANNWQGTFEGLPIYQEDGRTKIVYSVEEEEIWNYIPSYTVSQEGKVITVTNTYDYELPESGGMGTNGIMLGGIGFLITAALILIKSLLDRKCKSSS